MAKEIRVALEKLLDEGWELPIHFAMISVNGCIMAGSYEMQNDDTILPKVVTHHAPQPGFILPVNLMFVDSKTGEAVRMIFERDAESK
jgi:hypothetical protein